MVASAQGNTGLDKLDALDSATLKGRYASSHFRKKTSVLGYTVPFVATYQFEMSNDFAQAVEISVSKACGANVAFLKDIQYSPNPPEQEINSGSVKSQGGGGGGGGSRT